MTVEIKSFARSSAFTRFQTLRVLLVRYADVWWIVALALITAAYSLQYDILRQPIPHDTTFHIYAAQQMLEGGVIYRDVAIIKAPLSDFVSAFAIWLARLFGISDIMGTRLMSLAMVMGTTGATYLAGRVLFRARAVGVIAALVMASWNFYGLRAVTGPEPKAFVIFFALLAFVFLAQQRWFLTGVCAALSALSWQPALIVQALALLFAFLAPWLAASSASTPEKFRCAFKNNLRVMAGFLALFAIVLIYLAANNAVEAAFNATIGANVRHYNNNQALVPLSQTLDENFAEIILDGTLYCFSYSEYWLIGVGIFSFFAIAAAQIFSAARAKRAPLNLHVTPLLLYTVGFAGFTLIDFDYCPDLIPFMPVIALSVGWLAYLAARFVAYLVARFWNAQYAARASLFTLSALALLLIAVYWFDAWGYQITGTSFLDQLAVVEKAREYLAPDDRVLSFGNTIVLIELRKQNPTKILHLGSKSGIGVLATEPGGVQGMIAALDADPPKLITIAREARPAWTRPLYEWFDMHYEPADVFGRANIRFLIRKEQIH